MPDMTLVPWANRVSPEAIGAYVIASSDAMRLHRGRLRRRSRAPASGERLSATACDGASPGLLIPACK